MKNILKRSAIALVLLSMLGCSKFGGSKSTSFSESSSPSPYPPAAMMRKAAPSPEAEEPPAAENDISQVERKVIYTAEVKIEVKKYDEALETIKKIAKDAGGYIADTHVDVGANDAKSGAITIRVPSSKFHDVLAGVRGIGNVKYEAEHGQDVTEEYFDLETRLNNSRKMEGRLLDLLEKQTKSVKDLLEVERELGRVRENIERMEGRRRFLDNRLSYSTVTVTLFEPYVYTSSVFDPLKEAWSRMWGNLIESVAGVISFIFAAVPWMLMGGFFLWLGIKLIRRWLRTRGQV